MALCASRERPSIVQRGSAATVVTTVVRRCISAKMEVQFDLFQRGDCPRFGRDANEVPEFNGNSNLVFCDKLMRCANCSFLTKSWINDNEKFENKPNSSRFSMPF